VGYEADENQVGIMQLQVRTYLHQPRTGQENPLYLEYVVVHEMAHILERDHGERFAKLMDSLLPDWRARRDALNAAPLVDETWW
jgi:hypothetical protein